jgi:hypothetical protein
MRGGQTDDELKMMLNDRSWPNLRYYPGIFLKRLRKTTKNFSQDSRSPGREMNPGPLEYEAGMLTIRPRRSVLIR